MKPFGERAILAVPDALWNIWKQHVSLILRITMFVKTLYISIFSVGIFFSQILRSQVLSEQIVLTDTKDSVFRNSQSKCFDKNGNYCFNVITAKGTYFYRNTDTIGPFQSINGIYGPKGEIETTQGYPYDGDKPWYFKNANGTKIYGPVMGVLKQFTDGNTKEYMAITTTYNDTAYYYVNEKLVSKFRIQKADKFRIEYDDWCSFSENGNVIFYVKTDSFYSIFVNGNLIGTSPESYTQLRINNNGQYIFAEGRRSKKKDGKYDYMFFTHSVDTILGPVRTVWHCGLKENGSYYYSGDDNGPNYVVINNSLYKNLGKVSNITMIDKTHFCFINSESGNQKMNMNGTSVSNPVQEISHPAVDADGNVAFYGLENYFLFKYINGQKQKEPITKFHVRGVPIYINPKGMSIHYFKTDDSTYLFSDNELLFPAFANSTNFKVIEYNDFLPHSYSRYGKENGNSLIYVEIDTLGYILFNGAISKSMLPIERWYEKNKVDNDIVTGECSDNGFFLIQKIGPRKFQINVNNKVYKELDGVDDILENSCYFDKSHLVFYGIKNSSFCRYNLEL